MNKDEKTLVDVAEELNAGYFEAKKHLMKNSKDRNIFIEILQSLFDIYGEYFGYPHTVVGFSLFKSDIIRIKNRIKKTKKLVVKKTKKIKEEFWYMVELEPVYHPREGDGEIFTSWQIANLNLDPDSY